VKAYRAIIHTTLFTLLSAYAFAGPGVDPTVFLYDHVPGGVGMARRLFDVREELVRRGRARVEGCECDEGCPACIGPEAGALGAPGRVEVVGAVLHEQRDAVVGCQPEVRERVSRLVGTLVQLPVTDRRARAHDNGGLAGIGLGVNSRVHDRNS